MPRGIATGVQPKSLAASSNESCSPLRNSDPAPRTGLTFEHIKWPKLIAITPSQGPSLGGTKAIISGSDFSERASQLGYLFCKFNTTVVPATFLSVNELICYAPEHDAQTINVEVTMNIQQYTSSDLRFDYTRAQLLHIAPAIP